jgi:tetratricopeptide (TPR) repeat protein
MGAFARLAAAAFIWGVATPAAQAAVTVIGGDFAKACYEAAKLGDLHLDIGANAYDQCTLAIETEALSTRDLAGTYVNRGIVSMDHQAYSDAQQDFERAMKLAPALGEAIVNHGAALVGQHRYAEGVGELTRGLALSPNEPEKAYFDRALAYEGLDDEKSAYFDYLKAAELAPKWPLPREQLSRFTVTRP